MGENISITSLLIPFVSEVEEFNTKFGKLNNQTPIIPNQADSDFVYNFVLEEVEELKEAYLKGDIVGVLDAILDITYVSLGNGAMTFGLKDKILAGYAEVHASNMSKSCKTVEEAIATVKKRSIEHKVPCHFEQINDIYIVYRTHDRKAMKSINYSKPNLTQFFTQEEIDKCKEGII
jgi:hypothetical protein